MNALNTFRTYFEQVILPLLNYSPNLYFESKIIDYPAISINFLRKQETNITRYDESILLVSSTCNNNNENTAYNILKEIIERLNLENGGLCIDEYSFIDPESPELTGYHVRIKKGTELKKVVNNYQSDLKSYSFELILGHVG